MIKPRNLIQVTSVVDIDVTKAIFDLQLFKHRAISVWGIAKILFVLDISHTTWPNSKLISVVTNLWNCKQGNKYTQTSAIIH